MYSFFVFSAVFNGVVSTLLGIFIFLKNKKSEVNRGFVYFCAAVAIWSFFYIGWPLAKNAEDTLFWFRLLHIGACFTPITYFHFVANWLGLWRQKRILIWLGYALAVFFSLFVFSDYFIAGMVPKFNMRFWAEPGLIYHFYLLYFFVYVLFSSFLLYSKHKTSSGIKKNQTKIILIGIALSFIGGSTNYFLWYNINIPPFGNILASSFVIFTAFAIIKYRFMDIRIVARKSFIYLGSAFFSLFSFSMIIWLFESFLNEGSLLVNYLYSLLVAVVFTFCFYFVEGLLKKVANEYLFASLYNYQETIRRVAQKLTNHNNLLEITELIAETIKKTIKPSRIGVLLVRNGRNAGSYEAVKLVGLKKRECLNLIKRDFLIKYLEKNKFPLVVDELPFLAAETKSSAERREMENVHKLAVAMEAALCLPLVNEKKLIGIIILGSKISGDSYSSEDLELLSTLANQAGIAINNAKLYKQVQDFNQILRSKVNKQTKKLRVEAKKLEEQNDRLNKLLAVKNEFLRVVNHQINTPLSIIKNSIFMVKRKSFTVDKGLAFIEEGVRRMEGVFNDFWRAFSFEGEGVKMNFRKVDMNEVAGKIVETVLGVEEVKVKNIRIIFEKETRLPKAKTDPVQISQVLSNLLDNAITYTPAGSVAIRIEKIKGFLKVSVSDTGQGIDKKDVSNLFEKFYRTERAKRSRPGGSGLGLYIAKKIVEAGGGQIKIERSEVGKGTTFSFTVPIWK